MSENHAAHLAQYCREQQNLDHQLLLLDAYQATVRRYRISSASQIAFFAYVLAEVDHSGDYPNVVAPAIALLIEQNLRALRLKDAPAEGRA